MKIENRCRQMGSWLTKMPGELASELHRDQRGSISIVTVFSVMLLAVILGMIINIGRHADRKIKMQNAVDSSAYSGGVVLARGMNTLAFTNRLICDVFAMTAFLREARDRNAEQASEPILAEWEQLEPLFAKSEFQKFAEMDGPLSAQVQLERDMILTFGEHYSVVSEQTLPVMESILAEEMIPQFQRTLVTTIPGMAQEASDEIARRHGDFGGALSNGSPMRGALWRTDVTPVGGANEMIDPTLPVVDPTTDTSGFSAEYMDESRRMRFAVAHQYLNLLNGEQLGWYHSDRHFINSVRSLGRKSRFATLWDSFTCGQLRKLLEEEYPNRNLLFMLRKDAAMDFDEFQEQDFFDDSVVLAQNDVLNDHYMFVGVSYWEHMNEHLPGLFQNPMDQHDMTFAQVSLFLPRARLVVNHRYPGPYIPPRESPLVRNGYPSEWNLLNQNWTVQIVPATSPAIPEILQTTPPGMDVQPQQLSSLDTEGVRELITH